MSDDLADEASKWQRRWPGLLAGPAEMLEGTLIFPIEGTDGKRTWDEEDRAAAERVYPDQPVMLTDDRLLILVGPGAEAMTAMLRIAGNL